MEKVIYDIEVFPNFFCACFEDYSSDQKYYFELSEWQDDKIKLFNFIKGKTLIGYNNMMYDNIVLNYIMSKLVTNKDIYEMSNYAIKDNYEAIKKYKYNNNYQSIDIMRMMFSKMQRVSLKQLQVTMNWHNVLECELPFHQNIKESNREEIKYYCKNDVSSTKQLVKINKDKLNLRTTIENNFGVKCMSKDDVQTGVSLFAKLYENKVGNTEFLKQKTNRESIAIRDCISDKIIFTSKIFQDFLNLLKTKTITEPKGAFDYKILYANTLLVFGLGGIHSADKPGVYKPKDDEFYLDIDVTGMYPSIWINSEKAPAHLDSNIFIPIYKWIRDTRAANKKTNKMLADTLKLATNGSFGNLMNAYSWLFDNLLGMTITICGQLFLTMLIERLVDFGVRIESCNTDGISLFVKKDKYEEMLLICKKWENEVGLGLEEARYYKTIRRNVNCYYAWYANDDGTPMYKNGKPYVKEKGDFLTEVVLGKGYDKPIISKALKAYFIEGIPIEQFIRNHTNIYDFCMMQKVGGKFDTMWNGVKQQKTNRFYVSSSPNKPYLIKKDRETGKEISVLSSFGVELFNKYYEVNDFSEYKIHYGYYISETKKIIEEIEPRQYNLFD